MKSAITDLKQNLEYTENVKTHYLTILSRLWYLY